MRKLYAILFLCVASMMAVSAIAQTIKAIKVVHLNDYQVFVSCTNGRTPAVQNVAGQLAISCEGRQQ
jgi:hypothetical protein